MRAAASRTWLAICAQASCALAICLAGGPVAAAPTPERIVSWRMRILPRERYVALQNEWRAYAKAHPRDPLGWTELAKAERYAGAPCEEYIKYAEKAVRLAPNDAGACAALGEYRWSMRCPGQPDDPSEAARLLDRALKLDPNLDAPHYSLWVIRLSQGRRQEAEAHLRALLDRGFMPEPLVDVGYNLLVGVEPNAIVLTNGDNDTYPPLALQAARGYRTDVAIVNLSLLNTEWYRRSLKDGPLAVPVPLLERKEPGVQSPQAVTGLIESLRKAGWKRPLYLAVTVNLEGYSFPNKLSLEGLVYRVLPGAGSGVEIDPERLALNLDKRYRLESATSLAVNWQAWSSLRGLMANYATARAQLAAALAAAGNLADARAQMARALDLSDFQKDKPLGRRLIDGWSRWDSGSQELTRWKERFGP